MSDKSAPFPMLRAAYLRAIARVWRHPAVLDTLLRHSRDDPRGVLPLFEREFGFIFPFPNVKLVISTEKSPRWEPVGTLGWFGFADTFKVALPAKPHEQDDEAELLAEYMQAFPSLLGVAKLLLAKVGLAKIGPAEDGPSAVPLPIEVPPPIEAPLPIEAPDDFAWFGLVTGRVIALAWHNRDFRHQLFGVDDARALVQNAMDVIIPWNFCLKFTEYDVPKVPKVPKKEALPDPSHLLSTMRFDFKNFPFTEICLNMPEKPREDQHYAIALAAYNHTGGQYPFTCG